MAPAHAAAQRARRAGPGARPAAGFTLVELMVTISLIVVVMALAAPSFTAFQRNAQLTSSANTLLSSLTAARAEAMKRGRNVTVAPTDGSNWNSGWIVFVDEDGSGAKASGEEVLATEPAPESTITIETVPASTAYVMFNGSGYPRLANGAFQSSSIDFTHGLSSEQRRIVSSPAGRLRICKPDPTTCAAAVL
ncbi:MAG: GspH/FimT family pseudopilin [Piscinibacter sp.]|jgi:type IV fimbrial biogenesis protein FimT|nr:GspH/FimT family pseudopilin [Piscinibacter sp.]